MSLADQKIIASRSIDELPGPRGLPLLGNALQLRPTTLHSVAEEWGRRYGPVFRFKIGPRQVIGLCDPDAINAVMRDRPHGFRRWREVESVFDEMGISGLFSDEGERWQRSRRVVVKALNSNHLQRYFDVIRIANERLHRRMEKLAQDGRAFDIGAELTAYSVDITSALAFGHDLNTLERGEVELQGHIERVFRMLGQRNFAPVPYWRWVKLPADRALDRSLAELHDAVAGFVEAARKRMDARPELYEEPENFLESMLATQRTESAFTDEEIAGNTFTLLLAGEDTTAHTMAWTLWLLAQHPEAQARWAEEAREVLGESAFPAEYETVDRFSFGEAVLRESMRLRPVAPANFLEALSDTTVAGVEIPAGTALMLLMRHAGLHERGVERSLEFEPERWLEEETAPSQKSFLAFGAGPRFSPGRNLAFLESKAGMAMLARNFEIELDGAAEPVTEALNFTMVPEGLSVYLRERRANETAAAVGSRG